MYTGDPVIELSASDIPIIDNKTFSSHQSSGRLPWRQQEIEKYWPHHKNGSNLTWPLRIYDSEKNVILGHINTTMVQMVSGGDCFHGNVERLQRAFDDEIKFKNLIWRYEVNTLRHPSNFNVGWKFGSNHQLHYQFGLRRRLLLESGAFGSINCHIPLSRNNKHVLYRIQFTFFRIQFINWKM